MPSKFESMRLDDRHWKLGSIYYCKQDPRVVVRNRFFIGWAWNFGNRFVMPAICLAITLFGLPATIAFWMGVRSRIAIGSILVLSLIAIMTLASHLSREPDPRH